MEVASALKLGGSASTWESLAIKQGRLDGFEHGNNFWSLLELPRVACNFCLHMWGRER